MTERDRALQSALKLLRTRDRFTREIVDRLRTEGFQQEDVEYVVEHLCKKGILNDDNTTQKHIERNSGKRAVGTEKLRAELERLGAPEETIEANLAGIATDEPERALEALRAKYKEGSDRAKAGRFLFSRGFQEEAIETALDRFCKPAEFPE
jgi:SOS response regulatory protein OraA/RecX